MKVNSNMSWRNDAELNERGDKIDANGLDLTIRHIETTPMAKQPHEDLLLLANGDSNSNNVSQIGA